MTDGNTDEARPAMVTAHYDPDHGTVTLTFAPGIWADEVRTRRARLDQAGDEVRVGLVGDQEWIKAHESQECELVSVTEGAAPSEDELLAKLRAEAAMAELEPSASTITPESWTGGLAVR